MNFTQTTFQDIDECSSRNTCSQTCVNNAGSYQCGCDFGYSLDEDGFTCSG